MIASKKSALGAVTRSRTALAVFAATVVFGGGITEASARGYRHHHFHHHHGGTHRPLRAALQGLAGQLEMAFGDLGQLCANLGQGRMGEDFGDLDTDDAMFAQQLVRQIEAADAGIGVIIAITEGIPVLDMARAMRYLKDNRISYTYWSWNPGRY